MAAGPGWVHSESGSAPAAEDRLAALARASGPLRRVLAALAVQWIDAGGEGGEKAWERLGYARLADHARERLGVSARTLQELARVGRRLEGLPRLEAALVSGELPWSKARLLARFVTAEDEAAWIGYARGVRVRALERALRAVDRGSLEAGGLAAAPTLATDEEGMGGEPCERLRLRGSPALCFKWQRAQEYASRVAGARLPAGALLELVTAEVLSALPLAAEADGEAKASEGQCWSDSLEEGSGPAAEAIGPTADVCAAQGGSAHTEPPTGGLVELPAFLRPLLAGLGEADAFELDARLRRAIRLEQRLDAEIARWLRRVTGSGYTWRHRYLTLEVFARERLGMSPRKARALLRLERVGDACPELRRAFRDGRLSWVQAQALAPLLAARPEEDLSWRASWVGFATQVSVRALEDAVADARVAREADPDTWQQLRDRPDHFGAGAARPSRVPGWQTCAPHKDPFGAVHIRIQAPRDVARLFRAALCTVRRALERQTGRLPGEGEGFEAMLDHALTSWGADDPWLKRRIRRQYRVFERDGWRCTVPGCSARRNLHAHHIEFRSRGGSDAPENLTTLCAVHHQRGVHAGRVEITGRAPSALVYELGLRPGLPPLERYRSGDRKNSTVRRIPSLNGVRASQPSSRRAFSGLSTERRTSPGLGGAERAGVSTP